MIVTATAIQIERHRKHRPEEYWAALEPAKLWDLPDGGAEYDTDHPAWVAAKAKYASQANRSTGCAGCGGKSLVNLAADPVAMEAALAE